MAHPASLPPDADGWSRFLGRAEYDGYSGPIGPMTEAQYLAFEDSVPGRFEYVNGYAYSVAAALMSGGTHAHARIITNVVVGLGLRTRGTPCETFTSDFRLLTPSGGRFYPDAAVSCGPPLEDTARDLTDPCLLVEVLSPSTGHVDHGQKLDRYRAIPTLHSYLIVESTWRAVSRHVRNDAEEWLTELVTDAEGSISLPCPVGAALTLDEIYRGLNLPTQPPDPPPTPTLRRVREELAAGAGYAAG